MGYFKIRMRIFTVLFFCICYCFKLVGAPKASYQHEIYQYTQKDGLADNTLFAIHQDKRGFLWLGTDIGISRYDGVFFHNYNLVDIEPQAIKRICEMEQDNLLWLKKGYSNQIACFDKNNEKFIQLTSASETLLNSIYDLCIADSGLYAVTSEGLIQLNYERTKSSIHLTPKKLASNKTSLRKIVGDNQYLYALDQANNILIYNHHTKTQKTLSYNRLQTHKCINNIRVLNGCLWITTDWNGTYCYSTEQDKLRMIDLSNDSNQYFIGHVAMKNDSTFLATTPNSILYLNFSGTDYINNKVEIVEKPFDNFIYTQNHITDLYVDQKNAILWFCTFGKGLLKSNFNNNETGRIHLEEKLKDMNGVAEDIKGHIWITTNHHGVWRSTDNQLSPDMNFEHWNNDSKSGYYCMHKNENNLWMGNDMGLVYKINTQNNQTETFYPTYDGKSSIGSIRQIYYCIHNKLWLASDKGLFIYDPLTNECLAGMPYNGNIEKITSLCEDRDGVMWIGTNNGVHTGILKGKEIQTTNDLENQLEISNSEVLKIYMNRYNHIYIAYEDKIVRTEERKSTNIKVLQKDISNGHIRCIIDDKSGNTWMGNNIGIKTINNKTGATFTYTYAERFYDVCQLNNGQLLWGSSSGLLFFDPIKQKSKKATELIISDININNNTVDVDEQINRQVILNKPIYLTDKLVLKNNNNNVIFHITNLTYNQTPDKMEYRLLPIEKEWQGTYKNHIEYDDLEAGNYTLEIRPVSINNEEATITKLNLQVKRHWSLSWIAFSLYIVATVVLVLFTLYYIRSKTARRNFHKKKEQMLKSSLYQEIEERKEEKVINRLRNQARYNLVRELSTPLALISAPLKEMANATLLPAVFQSKVKLAYRNAIGMQDVCRLMLDIYELENEKLELNVAPYNITNVLNNSIMSANELLNVTPIKLHYDKDAQIKKDIWIDRKKIEYILRNVLSNAFRHISYRGTIKISAFIVNKENKEYCCYQIKDDGKDIIKKSAVYLLSKEEGGEELTSQLHSDLGIILMKEHIAAHHGDIEIEQDTETGNCMNIYIPMGKEHFNNDTHVKFVEPEILKQPDTNDSKLMTSTEKEAQIKEEENNATLLSTTPAGKHKILVIEDHKDIRLYLKVLFNHDYTVIMAENGEEGVKLAQSEMPDVIISDIMMPVMDGFEATKRLKENLKTCHIPILLLTALAGDTNAVKGLDCGAEDYILKPFNADILRSKVKRLIEDRQKLKQAYMKLMMASESKNNNNESPEDEQKEDPFIKHIFEIVENNLQNPDFNVKRLAEMVNMSQPTLYRRVKMLTNYTIIELIRGVRLRRATELLRTKKYSIQEVSEMVGYNDAPTFRKHFIELYGTTPSAFCKEETNEKK